MGLSPTVLLITRDKESDYSKQIQNAVSKTGYKIVLMEPTFDALSRVVHDGVSVVVLNEEELGHIADYFHKAVRRFHSSTPMIITTEKHIFLDAIWVKTFNRNISVDEWADLITEAVRQDHEHAITSYEFSKKIDVVKDLTGDALQEAIDKARSETFDKLKERFKDISSIPPSP